MDDEFIIEMNNIDKRFGAVQAVSQGQFNLKKGEIHSLIGENGAGKSTMMKILYGIYPLDNGEIKIQNELIVEMTPKLAIKHEIGMVHQEFMLVNNMTVLENIILGFEPKNFGRINFEQARREIQHYIDAYNMFVQPNKFINQISVGEAQRVEIIKTLYRGANILILDEPTAVLTPQEAEKLFEILRNLTESGKSVIFISHKLNEVMAISDRITVMRQGKHIATVNKTETSIPELAKLMVGREVFLNIDHPQANPGEVVLSVENIWTSGEKELSKIRDVSLKVHAGEIVGIAGVDGNGQSELIEAITGLRKVERGKVFVRGAEVTNKSPKDIRKSGLAHIPEDRNLRGLNRSLTVKENLIAVRLDEKPFANGLFRNQSAVKAYADKLVAKFDVRPADSDLPVASFSGGNAQKVVVAREADADGNLLIASQPTRGVDIGSIESIRRILNQAKENQKGILLVSADLDEIFALSDRIAVMYEGRIMGILNAAEATEEIVGLLMLGQTPELMNKEA